MQHSKDEVINVESLKEQHENSLSFVSLTQLERESEKEAYFFLKQNSDLNQYMTSHLSLEDLHRFCKSAGYAYSPYVTNLRQI